MSEFLSKFDGGELIGLVAVAGGLFVGLVCGASAIIMGRLCALRRESEDDVYSCGAADHPARAERAGD